MDKVDKVDIKMSDSITRLRELRTYKSVVQSYCKTNKVSSYHMLLLSMADVYESTQSILMFLTQENLIKDDRVKWYNNVRDFEYRLSNWSFTWRELSEKHNYLDMEGSVGRSGITNVKLNLTGQKLVENLFLAIDTYKENADKTLNEQENIVRDLEIDTYQHKHLLNLSEIPNELLTELQHNADKGYMNLLNAVAQKHNYGQDTIKLRNMPIFFNITEDMKTDSYNPEYFKGGLSLLEAYVVGYSELKEIYMGTIYRCSKDETHTIIGDKPDEKKHCAFCGDLSDMDKETDILYPVYELALDFDKGDKMTAYIHAELWKPSLNQGNVQKFLLYKMDRKPSGKKVASDVNYLIVGYEIKEEEEPNFNAAKKIAEKETQQILDVFDNSLLSEIEGSKDLKDVAVLTMGSINTQELLIPKGKDRYVPKRGILNTLFYGTAGTGKTHVAKKMVDLIKVGVADAMSSETSERGWTSAYVDGYIRPGLIPMNNTRAVLIDELDKFTDGYGWLLGPLENKYINTAKGGVVAEFSANTVIYMTANNIKPFEFMDGNILEQLKKEIDRKGNKNNPVISRTDLIVVLKEGATALDILDSFLDLKDTEIVEIEELKNYIKCMRTITKVKLTRESMMELKKILQDMKYNPKDAGRFIETCYRIAGAIAKLHLRDVVTPQDIQEAMHYFSRTLRTLGEVNDVWENWNEIVERPMSEKMEDTILEFIKARPISEVELSSKVSFDVKPILKNLNYQQYITKEFVNNEWIWRALE